jgi:hypothetical protein
MPLPLYHLTWSIGACVNLTTLRKRSNFGFGLRIHREVVSFEQCCGSVTFWYGSGSADPCLLLMDPDPDPAIFVIAFQC